MKSNHYRAISTRNIKRLRKAIALCLLDLDEAVENSILLDGSKLRGSLDRGFECYEQALWPGQPSSKELDEIF